MEPVFISERRRGETSRRRPASTWPPARPSSSHIFHLLFSFLQDVKNHTLLPLHSSSFHSQSLFKKKKHLLHNQSSSLQKSEETQHDVFLGSAVSQRGGFLLVPSGCSCCRFQCVHNPDPELHTHSLSHRHTSALIGMVPINCVQECSLNPAEAFFFLLLFKRGDATGSSSLSSFFFFFFWRRRRL